KAPREAEGHSADPSRVHMRAWRKARITRPRRRPIAAKGVGEVTLASRRAAYRGRTSRYARGRCLRGSLEWISIGKRPVAVAVKRNNVTRFGAASLSMS